MTSLHRVGMLFAIWLVVGGVGQAERASWTTSKLVGSPDPPPPFSAEDAFPNLSFDPPVEIAHVPGTNQIFVAQRDGKILTFANRKDCDQSDVVLDLKNRHSNMEDCYSLTFHPDFATNHYMYVCYTRDLEVDGTFVSRFTLSSLDPPAVDVESEVVILRWLRGGHNGCCLKFGPDGFLYISSGDGGAPNPPDPRNAGQDLTRLLSKILRIDVDHPTDGLAYRVPEDNPFVGVSNVRPETWAYGLRNPWRMSFDRATGDLWVGDVGWQLWEMVYRIEKGGNYGWSVMEGPQPARPELERGPTPILPPIISHPHSEAASVTGGFVYHGQKFPELRGAYIYGDFQSGKVWALRYDGKQVTFHQEIAQTPIGIVAFAEAPDGELLLLDHGPHNKIFELVRNRSFGQQSEFPKRLSETGLFQSTVDLSPAAGVRELQVNAKHWADGTVSQRWMAVPGSAPIQVRDNGRWILPEGSALVKTISMPIAHEGVTSLRRLETQLLLRDGGAWHPYSYQWNEQQTDAVLVPAGGATMPLSLTPAASATNASERTHRIVSRAECQMCHNAWASLEGLGHGTQSASPLSIQTSQLNRPETHDGRSENQMTILQREGWLDPEMVIDSHATDRLVDPYDESQDLDRRV
ncbi:MAG: PQQ-dependent sugar dehydrogenase, partial [Planctomycetota bacterium]|nr:PQQ-dependent sugar dehydrogenase [Planctomycetota bacterium]